MDGFKPVVKMKCGGSVTKAVAKCSGGRMKEGGKVEHSDIKEDKKLVKKAFSLHDDQKHEGKTDLSALKKGGRCKKEGGKVRKFADGGLTGTPLQAVLNADQLRKRRAMMGANPTAPAMGAPAAAPAAPVAQPTPQNIGATTGPIMKRGGKVKK